MGIPAKKSLGQNFLKSQAALDAIIAASDILPGDLVLEIGPGKGALTRELLNAGAHVVAVEKDDRLIPFLKDEFAEAITDGRLAIAHADILDPRVLGMLRADLGIDTGTFKLIANIPYYITGKIFRQFLEHGPRPTHLVVLVQKEVAEQIARSAKESILSISIKAFGDPRYVRTVPRGAFAPAPGVDSAILAITGISGERLASIDSNEFFALIKAGFASKRKMLAGNLTHRTLFGFRRERGAIENILAAIQIDPKSRAEDLPIDRWLALANTMSASPTKNRP
ncbi:MAG TPA: 16S rRNA (adenine(1518)-N(6)/adenine(1519)-N(6))-dimethyltransferase RsmA [Candidatus Paceibacterota bacterium]|nr:16S rRNA (adenine(1518)-N(6)/adenine(1519)-N(6))-dimethyltransferase RsmA [Candidatus Paceibacterota bacterium]